MGLSTADGKVSVVVATTEAAREIGVGAGAVLRPLLAAIDGRGGGKDDVAQGGGALAEGVPAALAAVDDAVLAARGA